MAKQPYKDLFYEKEGSQTELVRGKNHLLMIGIDQYQHLGKLANAVRDACAVKQVLLDKYCFEETETTEVYDLKATRRGIMQTLRRSITTTKAEDNLLVYFSGHGHYDEQIKEGYWVPVDAEFSEIDDYVSYSFLTKIIQAIPARHCVFIVDSCYSGAALVRKRDPSHKRLERDPSRWLLASGRNEVVPDGIAGEHSPFADKLIDILGRYALDGLRMGTLVEKLTTAVTYNSSQTPIGRPLFNVGDQGGEFIFRPKRNQEADYQLAQTAGTSNALQELEIQEAINKAKLKVEGLQAIVKQKVEPAPQEKKVQKNKTLVQHPWYHHQALEWIGIAIPALLLMIWGISGLVGEKAEAESTQPPQSIAQNTHGDSIQSLTLEPMVKESGDERPDVIIQLKSQGYKILEPWESERAVYHAPNGQMGLLDRRGNRLGGTYDKVEDLAYGFAVFHQNKLRGYLKLSTGTEVIKAQYARAWPFGPNGLAKVKGQGGKTFYINPLGECVQNCETDLPIPLPKMIRIAGGTFQMGDTVEDDEKPIHPVTVSTFYLAETELSFAQYDFYCEQTGRKMPNDEGWGRDNRPVINVSWDDAQSYIQWLNAQPGQSGWRLPTEAEWEYAAGGGASVRTQWAGTDSERYLGNYAIYNTNKTSSVKSKRVHGELYDMSGNVREWCLDWYGRDYYVDSPASNPQGPSTGTERVLRGGGWSSYADKCRVASRRGHWPDYRIRNIGFRLARSL